MSEDPVNVYPAFCTNVLPSHHAGLWYNIAQPRLCFPNPAMMSQQQRGCYVHGSTGEPILVYNSGDHRNVDRRVKPPIRAGAEEMGYDVAHMSGIMPSEYQLFGTPNALNVYAASLTNHAVSTAADPTQSVVMPKPLHRVPTARQQHYHQRHHAQAKHPQANNLKNKTRFSATGLSYNYTIVRDTKMFLSSAPSSPSAGSIGGSLGNNYLSSHPHAPANNAFCVPQYKGSSSSSSSCCSTTGLKISSSSLSSYSSRSSMPSMPSLSGNSPRKRRADDVELRCVKGYMRPSVGEARGLCSCETCLTEEVSARVDDVTIRDVMTADRSEKQHKRSKNDDDVVFVSAEPGPAVLHNKRKVRTIRKAKKTNRKVANRLVEQQRESGFQAPFVVLPPSQPASVESKDGAGRYFLRSAVKARKQDDYIPTSPPQPAAFVQLSGNDTTPTKYGVDTDGNVNGVVLDDGGASTYPQGTERASSSSPRYHTRSRQKRADAEQRKPRVQLDLPVTNDLSKRAEDYRVASVIQAAVQTSNRNKQQQQQCVPISPQSPPPNEGTRDTPRSSSSLKKLYDIHGIIGVGGGGTVFAGTRKSDGVQVAIKQVPKSKVKRWGRLDGRTVPIEFELLHRASCSGHPGVIQMLDWYERRNAYILVMERPQPVIDLFDYLNQHGALSEASARNIFRQIAEAVLHCHAQGVVHRDIKDENVILNLYNSSAKLIDFGCGTVLKNTPYTEFAGTPEFYPPEWFTHRRYYGERVDAWSLGVLLYTMVEAEVPFQKEQDIVECKIRYKKGVSDPCKHLIAWLLQKDQHARPTIREMLSHPWIHGMDAPLFVGPNTQATAPTPLAKGDAYPIMESSTESPDRPARYTESQPSPPYQRPYRDAHHNGGVYHTGFVAR